MRGKFFAVMGLTLILASCASLIPSGMSAPDLSKVTIGMSASAVKEAIGPPMDVNTTTTESGTHQQWVYTEYSFLYGNLTPVAYLYFDNGILTAIQN